MSEREENHRSFAKLKRFTEPRQKPSRVACEFCASGIEEKHSHVVNIDSRSLLCVCRACYLLFTHDGAAKGKYKAVPERYLYFADLILTDGLWDGLQIPVGIAFFFFNSILQRMVALYPSPAGAMQSELSLESWEEFVRLNPLLSTLGADVEALLVYNVKRRERSECFIVPIDACYELVGRIRRRWKGFDGGEEAWSEIDAFFSTIRERSGADPRTEAVR